MYCLPVAHSISTRYASNMNYRVPLFTTNRGQKSIKFTGPKVWSQIPLEIKEIGFRKPFSRGMKNYLLNIIAEKSRNLPVQSKTPPWQIDNELLNIFNTTDDETFYGFDMLSLTKLFESDLETSDFLGFDLLSLTELFQNKTTDSEFLGF